MADDIKQELPNNDAKDKQEQPLTVTEIIASIILIGYMISLIWLAGSKHWFGLW